MQNNDFGVVLGLDVGDVRIGVARGHTFAKLPEPLEVINRTKLNAVQRIKLLAAEHGAEALIIGLPSLKSGSEGEQAEAVRSFAKELQLTLAIPQIFVDESHSSQEADEYLVSKTWKQQESNDALAACVILDRYFKEVAHV